MGDAEALSDYPDSAQRYAVCNSLWSSRMTDRAALLDIIRKRHSRDGIVTADRYFREIEGCFNGGFCPVKHVGAESGDQWTKALKDAESKLTFSGPELRVTKTALKKGASEAMRFDAIITTPHKDRDGDILMTDGAMLDPKSPLLWQHVAMSPIGAVVKTLKHTKDELRARFAIADTELGRDAATLIKAGALRISHGFDPKEWEPIDDAEEGWLFKSFEIFEVSVVSIPSNIQAVITDIGEKSFRSKLVKGWAHNLELQKSIVEATQATADVFKDGNMAECPKCGHKGQMSDFRRDGENAMKCPECGYSGPMSEFMDKSAESEIKKFSLTDDQSKGILDLREMLEKSGARISQTTRNQLTEVLRDIEAIGETAELPRATGALVNSALSVLRSLLAEPDEERSAEREYLAELATTEDTDALRRAHRNIGLILRHREEQEEARLLDELFQT